MARASNIQACVFVNTPSSKVFEYDNQGIPVDIKTEALEDRERKAYIAMQDAFNMATSKNGAFQYENYVCPWDWGNNNAVMAEHGLFVFPAAVITATYPDGSKKQYVLGKEFIDKLTGGIWTADKIYPYIRVLLLDLNPQDNDTTLICKFIPPLCSVGGWIWLALAAGATYKASSAKGVTRAAWGAGAFLLWKEWYDRGGLQQLSKTVGIGKFYDDVTIRPGSRVDDYWGILKPSPRKYGVEDYRMSYFLKVQDAIKHFRLYSIEFGNWLNQEERLNFMYATLVTLRDMAEVIGCKQEKMGLHKKLSLAFGSRGKGGFVAAFYQPYNLLINLTKTMGRGSFCHEYGHAVDHHLGWQSGMKSQRKQPDYSGKRQGSAAWLFEKVLDGVLWNEDGSPSSYQMWLDTSTEYFNRRAEIFARICETYFSTQFKAKGISNTWGVGGIREDMPKANLVEKVAPQIKKIFQLATK